MANHLTLQSCQNEIHSKNHQEDADEEQWMVVDRLMCKEVTSNDNKHIHHHTQEKCPETQRARRSAGVYAKKS